jgi:hypothetical protein
MRGPAASPGLAMRRSLWEEASIRYRLRAQMRSSECCCSFLVNRARFLDKQKQLLQARRVAQGLACDGFNPQKYL